MYSQTVIENGQKWIEEKLGELAKNLGLNVQELKWQQMSQDSNREQLSLVFSVNGKQEIVKFGNDEIADCAGEKECVRRKPVQTKLENKLKKDLLQRFCPPEKRIGF